MSTSAIPCRYWVSQGRCFFGSDCKYLHTTHNANNTPASSVVTSKPTSATVSSSSASASTASVPVSRASNRASFRPLAILSDDGQPLVQPTATATPAQPAASSPIAEQTYQLDDSDRQPATIYSGGDYHSPLSSSDDLNSSVDQPSADYATAEADSALLDGTASLSLYDPANAAALPYAGSVSGPASGLPSYPTQPAGHVSLPARSLTSQSTAAQSQSPHFLFADSSGVAVQSQPQRSFFMNETLRERLLFHQQLTADRLQPEDPVFSSLPISVDHERYHSLLPLPSDATQPAYKAHAVPIEAEYRTRYRVSLYKCTSSLDGRCYVLKRLYACRVKDEALHAAVRPWIELQRHHSVSGEGRADVREAAREEGMLSEELEGHSSVVAMRRAFNTTDFGDAVCVVYDYYPTAVTLEQRHLLPSLDASTPPSTFPSPLSEDTLWSYTCQLVSTIHAAHSASMALYDVISVRRVLVTAPNRLRLSNLALRDILLSKSDAPLPPNRPLRLYQMDDLYHLGQLLLSLATVTASSDVWPSHVPDTVDPTLEQSLPSHFRAMFRLAATRYSLDMVHLIAYLLTTSRLPAEHGSACSIFAVTSMIAHKLLQHSARAQQSAPFHTHDSMQRHIAAVESDLSRELQNGRLFRLLTQLNWITERPHLLGDRQWCSTGDRYLLSLFRDCVFHSESTDGRPVADLSFVVDQLNRLDVASSEKALLSSRDGEAMLIVRYADLKQAMQQAMHELLLAGATHGVQQQGVVGAGGGQQQQHGLL